jgi:hypothetical protein
MTIFRHIQNGKLYTIEMVKRRMYTEAPRPVATPFLHNETLKNVKMEQFVAVAYT